MKESIKLITLAIIDMDIENLQSLIEGESDENKVIHNPWTGNNNRCGFYSRQIHELTLLKGRILDGKLISKIPGLEDCPDDFYIESYLTWFKDLLENQIKYIEEGNNIYDNKDEK